MLQPLEHLGRFAHFALRALAPTLLAWRRPAELSRQFYLVLLGSLPLGVVAGLALGFVTWVHLHGVVNPIVREQVPWTSCSNSPLGTGLILAGRSSAELGSVRLNAS
jgi:phospholipid/cholesterol/gamma-HCH transport system permease protein